MDRDELAAVVKEYDRRGTHIHELLKVNSAEVRRWLGGARIPPSQKTKLEWWASQLRVLEASRPTGM